MIRLLFVSILLSVGAFATTIAESATGMRASLYPDGTYVIYVQDPPWTFGGSLSGAPQQVQQKGGTDSIGAYDEITFQFADGTPTQGGIRLYGQKPLVLFTFTLLAAGENRRTFPRLTSYPAGLYRLTNTGWEPHFDKSETDGALAEFDSSAQTFILSPASNFLIADTSIGPDQSITSGVSDKIQSLPAGFTHQTILTAAKGLNAAFETWGHALTDLQGKVRPANNADITLSHLGYWTDNGASYYYTFRRGYGCEGTLLAVRDEFRSKGVPLGYMQLDSWFYPKGAASDWRDGKGGIYEYVASPKLFPRGLGAFQQELGIPLMTHARWIDPSSPYRREYRMSNNVVIDPLYWGSTMDYLSDAGVTTYEQDWLSNYAQTDFNLSDPGAFMDDMAQAAAQRGMTLQYCLPGARHYLQSSKYNNVTTIRTSPDHFSRERWDRFLYGSRLASALGVWPWSDVFLSSEPDNLLLATLSAGPVGVGDRAGSVDATNLLRAVRSDGVIVKPDVPLIPTDQTVLQDAQDLRAAMVASTYTDFGTMKAAYVVAYPRGLDTTVSFQPSSLGMSGPVYVYDYLADTGQVMDAANQFSDLINGTYAYYVVTPIGPSGIGLLGDAEQLVPLGKQRISRVTDDGVLELAVAFAPGEIRRTIQGYSPEPPAVTAQTGTVGSVSYNAAMQRFRFSVSAGADGTATVDIASQ
jgi:hypothetical protein